jgi:SAM-dependent methyltransferase
MSFWDERYSVAEYVYGTAPNRWLEAEAYRIPRGGRVLSLGEGEGRNAVWLAEQGYDVTAVDSSPVGLEKARRLAEARGVEVRTVLADLAGFRPDPGSFDGLVLVYVHLPPAIRASAHAAAAAALRPGGVVILEAFTPRQLSLSSGGPRQADMLYDVATVRADFPGIEWEVLEEAEIELVEGIHHAGRAAVLRGVGRATALGARTAPIGRD